MFPAQSSQRSACFAPAPRVRVGHAQDGTLAFVHFLATTVANEHGLPGQDRSFPAGIATGILSGFSTLAYPPRAKQRECRLFLLIETDITRGDDAQMAWTEIIDRSPVEVLLDDRRRDV